MTDTHRPAASPAPPSLASPSRPPRRIAIVGAGFSGTATAVQLLRQAPPEGLQVVLINESGRMARGLAYGTHSVEHVLNVPAGNMSALADDADDFVRYCRWSDPRVAPGDFVSRRLYGAYLEALLSAAELTSPAGATLERLVGSVVGLNIHGPAGAQPTRGPNGLQSTRGPNGLQSTDGPNGLQSTDGPTGLQSTDDPTGPVELLLAQGTSVWADQVVLAFGHFTPIDPLPAAAVAAAGARYVRDPWRPGALQHIDPADEVLLVGAGLTAVDVAIVLARGGRQGRLHSTSRRGLAPQSHRRSGAAPGALDASVLVAAMGGTLRQQVRVLRRHVRAMLARGEDWRDAVGALRPHTPALWQRLSPADRSRFLRHVRPHWEVLRHRCAPEAHDAYQQLVDQGLLGVQAARISSVQREVGGLRVQIRPRGGEATRVLQVQHIVNCTGPSADLARCPSPLVRGLLEAGRLCPDPLGLGLAVDDHYAVLDRAGRVSPVLSYIGPLLKARDWEATAVPELRVHAQRLARRLLAGR